MAKYKNVKNEKSFNLEITLSWDDKKMKKDAKPVVVVAPGGVLGVAKTYVLNLCFS